LYVFGGHWRKRVYSANLYVFGGDWRTRVYSANLYVFGGNSRKRFDMYHRGRLKTSFLKNQIIIIVFQNQLMTPSIKSLT
jgi:hypothetical protein